MSYHSHYGLFEPEPSKAGMYIGYSTFLHLALALSLGWLAQNQFRPSQVETELISFEITSGAPTTQQIADSNIQLKGSSQSEVINAQAPPRSSSREKSTKPASPSNKPKARMGSPTLVQPAPTIATTTPAESSDLIANPRIESISFEQDLDPELSVPDDSALPTQNLSHTMSPDFAKDLESSIESMTSDNMAIDPLAEDATTDFDADSIKKYLQSSSDPLIQDSLESFDSAHARIAQEESLSEQRRAKLAQAADWKRAAALASASHKAPPSQNPTGQLGGKESSSQSDGLPSSGPTGASHGKGRKGGQQVRPLSALVQLPGNPIPRYDRDERLKGHHGRVVFRAYVNSSGVPIKLIKTQSTGFSNLDDKTLAALKRWRFRSGQEGWVEIPFLWDLQGNPEEFSSLNR